MFNWILSARHESLREEIEVESNFHRLLVEKNFVHFPAEASIDPSFGYDAMCSEPVGRSAIM